MLFNSLYFFGIQREKKQLKEIVQTFEVQTVVKEELAGQQTPGSSPKHLLTLVFNQGHGF